MLANKYSTDLRVGVATTLALLGQTSTTITGSNSTGEQWARAIVKELCSKANEDKTCRLWASLADVLTLLAEAAPSVFLDAVRNGLTGEKPLLAGLFTDGEGNHPLFVSSAHSSVLRALEVCAWSSEHFGQVVDLLARLVTTDPGGQLANRPTACLEHLFCPWHPQGAVGMDRRLKALEGLRRNHQGVAWNLMISMLPSTHGSALNIAAPRFRSWKPKAITVTVRDYWVFVEQVCQRLLEDVRSRHDRWTVLIPELSDFTPPSRGTAFGLLKEIAEGGSLEEQVRTGIWESLRAEVARHTEYQTAQWAMPVEEVAQMAEVARLFEPTAPSVRLAWLFDSHRPEIPDVHRGDDFAGHEEAVRVLRAKAMVEIARTTDWLQLRAFALDRKLPWDVGCAIADAGLHQYEAELVALLRSEDASDIDLGSGYVARCFRLNGWPWIEVRRIAGTLTALQHARLLHLTRDFPKAWEVAEGAGEEVAKAFWCEFNTLGLGRDFSHVAYAASRLLHAGRPASSMHLIELYVRRGATVEHDAQGATYAELLATGLETLLERRPDDPEHRRLDHYELMEIFSYLEGSDLPRPRVAKLEWAYLPAFGHDSKPRALSELLSTDPAFFADVVCKVYRPRLPDTSEDGGTLGAEAEEEASPSDRGVATNAYRLLTRWRRVPGRRDDGTIDAAVLGEWVTEARLRLREVGRQEFGDMHIGRVLAASPADSDGAWPCVEVRDLLEALQNGDLESAFKTQMYNDRGATSRAPLAGGEQERKEAADYRTRVERFQDQWPRTAAILRRHAESLESDALTFDTEAERLRTGFDD